VTSQNNYTYQFNTTDSTTMDSINNIEENTLSNLNNHMDNTSNTNIII